MARPWGIIKAKRECKRLGIVNPRSAERRDCARYQKCLSEAAMKDWLFIPCITCEDNPLL
jgi:hypothetical protein